ncbi:MAG: hypothetical protein ABW133_12570 [Polyangiaceae bacterium]
MTRLSTLLISISAMGAIFAGCAGQLTDAEKENLSRDREGGVTGGAGGAGGTDPAGGAGGTDPAGGTGGSTGGAGGATGGAGGAGGGMLDPCMAPLMTSKCSMVGCHGGSIQSAGLDLSPAVINAPQSLVDKANRGDPAGGCGASVGKIIDSQRPEQSLIYTKVTTATCGVAMPPTGKLATAETSCILNWIKSIPGVNGGGTGGAGGAGGTGGAGGAAGGSVDAGRDTRAGG